MNFKLKSAGTPVKMAKRVSPRFEVFLLLIPLVAVSGSLENLTHCTAQVGTTFEFVCRGGEEVVVDMPPSINLDRMKMTALKDRENNLIYKFSLENVSMADSGEYGCLDSGFDNDIFHMHAISEGMDDDRMPECYFILPDYGFHGYSPTGSQYPNQEPAETPMEETPMEEIPEEEIPEENEASINGNETNMDDTKTEMSDDEYDDDDAAKIDATVEVEAFDPDYDDIPENRPGTCELRVVCTRAQTGKPRKPAPHSSYVGHLTAGYKCAITSATLCQEPPSKNVNQTLEPVPLKLIRYQKYHISRCGQEITLQANYESISTPTFIWHDPQNNTIKANDIEEKFRVIEIPPNVVMLKITKIHLNDIGVYTLQVINNVTSKTVDFFVNVTAHPIVSITQEKKYYLKDEVASPSCQVDANPSAHMHMEFFSYPNYPSTEDARTIDLGTETMTGGDYQGIFKTSLTVKTSGTFVCHACNDLGCRYANSSIVMSDVKNGFGVLKSTPAEDVINDNVTLKCIASVFDHNNFVEWRHNNNTMLHETDRIKIERHNTSREYQAILHISKIQKSDEQDYVCVGQKQDGTKLTHKHELKIYDPIPAYFEETSLNGTEVEIDITAEGQKTVIFKCYTGGTPKPQVTWYKDDMLIKQDKRNQYVPMNNSQEMHVKFMSRYDSGKYLCRTQNRFGEMEAFLNISIKGDEVSSRAWIIAIVILVIGLCCVTIFFCIKIRREKVMRKELMKAGLGHFEKGAIESLNPELSIEEQAEYLPYDKSWEFPRDKLKLGKHLGSGAFGIVRKGSAYGILKDDETTTVAVKMVRRDTDPTSIRALASELKIMIHLGKHLNVVNLLGACTKNLIKRELMVIVEYCRFGNLQNHLLRHRDKFINQIDPVTGKIDPSINVQQPTGRKSDSDVAPGNSNLVIDVQDYSINLPNLQSYIIKEGKMDTIECPRNHNEYTDQNTQPLNTHVLVCWAFQVASGMEYLSSRKVLHGDLAARNLLLADNNIVKICDFGLSKAMYKDDNYMKKTNTPLPLKWMAIESIRDAVFSTQSDIWSFGIVLWEFFTLAKTPYPGIPIEQHYDKIADGYRMEKPEYATDIIYDIMAMCWKEIPSERPPFSDLVSSIGCLLQEPVVMHYANLNAPFENVNQKCFNESNDFLGMMSCPGQTTIPPPSPTHTYINVPSELTIKSADSSDESGIVTPGSTNDQPKFVFSEAPHVADLDSDEEYEIELQSRNDYIRKEGSENQRHKRSFNRDSGYWYDNNIVQPEDKNGYTHMADQVSNDAQYSTLMTKVENLYKKKQISRTSSVAVENPAYMYAEKYVQKSEV